MFDLFFTDYNPNFAHFISDDAVIVENEVFEKAVMRIARSLPLSLMSRKPLWYLY
jgi:hypothetical protein